MKKKIVDILYMILMCETDNKVLKVLLWAVNYLVIVPAIAAVLLILFVRRPANWSTFLEAVLIGAGLWIGRGIGMAARRLKARMCPKKG